MKLFLIDGIGPFFHGIPRQRINWSKIPFDHLEKDGMPDRDLLAKVRDEFAPFCRRAADVGFNAITLDNLAHLTQDPRYSAPVRASIDAYREEYAALIDIAVQAGLRPYLTTDVMFRHRELGAKRLDLERDVIPQLREASSQAFDLYPDLGGLILRIGECDGLDVKSQIRSELVIRTPRDANRLIRELLPEFERRDRHLVFRTWTVGAYSIGDLMWNRRTFDRAFKDVGGEHFILSMKYGESDFYRYLPLNRLIYRSDHHKIIEFQGRREYEGAGEYPAFVGWDYEKYVRHLHGARNVVGAWVWSQTGGWTGFRRRTFIDDEAVWNDINVIATLRLCRYEETTEQAVQWIAEHMLEGRPAGPLLALLRLSHEVVRELLYVEEYARRKLFFRRLRVPPLLSVFWDHVIVSHAMRRVLRNFVMDRTHAISQGYAALRKVQVMRDLTRELNLPVADIEFQLATYEILAVAREYYFGRHTTPEVRERLLVLRRRYQERFSDRWRYAVHLDFTHFMLSRSRMKWLLGLIFRDRRTYRFIDRLFMIRYLTFLSPLLLFLRRKYTPDFARNQAMGLDAILK